MNKLGLAFAVLVLLPACDGGKKPGAPSAGSAPAPTGSVRPAPLPEEPRGAPIPITSGPALLILPGQGVGPIRIGATVATIERLMNKPCEEKDAKVCRYPARAVEFLLDEQGATREIRIHRGERPVEGTDRKYGIFKGRSEEGLAPLMLKSAVKDLLGPPLKTEPVTEEGPAHTIEAQTYKGMRLEFDRLPSGNEVVGGIYITKP